MLKKQSNIEIIAQSLGTRKTKNLCAISISFHYEVVHANINNSVLRLETIKQNSTRIDAIFIPLPSNCKQWFYPIPIDTPDTSIVWCASIVIHVELCLHGKFLMHSNWKSMMHFINSINYCLFNIYFMTIDWISRNIHDTCCHKI